MERGYVRVIPSIKDNRSGQTQGTPVNPTIKHSQSWNQSRNGNLLQMRFKINQAADMMKGLSAWKKIQWRVDGLGSMVNLWLLTNGIRRASILTQMTLTDWFIRNIHQDLKDHLVPIGATLEDNGFARKKQVLISSTKRAIICESNAVVIHSFFPTSYPNPPPPPTPFLVLYPNVLFLKAAYCDYITTNSPSPSGE